MMQQNIMDQEIEEARRQLAAAVAIQDQPLKQAPAKVMVTDDGREVTAKKNNDEGVFYATWSNPGTGVMQNAATKSSIFRLAEDHPSYAALRKTRIRVATMDTPDEAEEQLESGIHKGRTYGALLESFDRAEDDVTHVQQIPCMFFVLADNAIELQTSDESSLKTAVQRMASTSGLTKIKVLCRIANEFVVDIPVLEEDDKINSLSKKLGTDAAILVKYCRENAVYGLEARQINFLEMESNRLLSMHKESKKQEKEEPTLGSEVSIRWVAAGTNIMQTAATKSSIFTIVDDKRFEKLAVDRIRVVGAEGDNNGMDVTHEIGIHAGRTYGGLLKSVDPETKQNYRTPCMFFVLAANTIELQTADNASLEGQVQSMSKGGFADLTIVCRIRHNNTVDIPNVSADEKLGALAKKLGIDSRAFSRTLRSLPEDHEFFNTEDAPLRAIDLERLELESNRLLGL